MTNSLEIRESVPDDIFLIETLYADAFPDEDLLPLVHDLLKEGPVVLSLVAVTGPSLVGHVIFTRCGVERTEDKVALLGPLGVASARQRQGIGSALVRAGLKRQESAGVAQVYVLGDPAYYGRLGFQPEFRIAPPYPLPPEWREAWQSMNLGSTKLPSEGKLTVPRPWLQPALWGP